jgi:hypothetical protein
VLGGGVVDQRPMSNTGFGQRERRKRSETHMEGGHMYDGKLLVVMGGLEEKKEVEW